MASGCGTAVFYGLLNNYDMYGIDPEDWKYKFNLMKAKEYNYPEEWKERFYKGVGENLPFPDDSFDCVTSYQTLEHVQNLFLCISEMVRVTKSGGGIHIHCPDYRGTYEGHYLLPWLPLFPKKLAKKYLQILGKSTLGLDLLNYTTKPKILKALKHITKNNPSFKYTVIDVNKNNDSNSKIRKFLPFYITSKIKYLQNMFKKETTVNLFIRIKKISDY